MAKNYVVVNGEQRKSIKVNGESVKKIKVNDELVYNKEETIFPNESTWEAKTNDSHWYITSATPTNITIKSEWWNHDTYANVVTSKAIDLTGYNTLSATFVITGYGAANAYNDWYVGVNKSKGDTPSNKGTKRITTNGTYTVTYDVSSLDGNYYVYFGGMYNYSNANCVVQSIMLN